MNNAKTLLAAAEAAVTELEAVAVGDPCAPAVTEAAELCLDPFATAQAELFPPGVAPVGANTLADFAFLEPKTPACYGGDLARLHGSSLEHHPELARLIRSPGIGERVCATAAAQATVLQRSAEELSNEARTQFQLDVAHQLTDDAELSDVASVFVAASMLLQRIDVSVELHEAHAAAAAEEAEADKLDGRLKRRGELVEQFRRLGPNHKFSLGELRNGARIGADEVAGVLVGGMWDMHFDALEEYLATLPEGLRDRAGVPA